MQMRTTVCSMLQNRKENTPHDNLGDTTPEIAPSRGQYIGRSGNFSCKHTECPVLARHKGTACPPHPQTTESNKTARRGILHNNPRNRRWNISGNQICATHDPACTVQIIQWSNPEAYNDGRRQCGQCRTSTLDCDSVVEQLQFAITDSNGDMLNHVKKANTKKELHAN